WMESYLNLKEDLAEWGKTYEAHPVLEKPLKVLPGLRLLRQEPWECTISYMFAQGLSVKVIRRALRKFCVEYGKRLENTVSQFGFPESSCFVGLSPDFLKPFTNNYRARADR